MDEALVGAMLASTLRVSTPLIFCALAGLLSERSGVVDIALEGKMLLAAFAAGACGAAFGSTTLALLAAMAVAISMSWVHGLACVSHKGDQVVSGVAINIIAVGLTAVLGAAWFHQGGQTPPVTPEVRIQTLFPALAEATRGLPFLGAVLGDGVLGHNALVYLALLAGATGLVAGVQNPFWPAFARGGRKPTDGRCCWGVGDAFALHRTHPERHVMWLGGQLPGISAKCQFFTKHDCGAWIHGAGGAHFWPLASGEGAVGLFVVWFSGCGGDSSARRSCAWFG